MRTESLTIVAILVAAVSCGVDDNTVLPDDYYAAPDKVYASFEPQGADGLTKVYLGEDTKLYWNAVDCISLFNKDNYSCKYKFDGTDGSRSGSFTNVNTDFYSAQPLTDNLIYAVYPYSSDYKIVPENSVISLNVPSVQQYVENSFGLGANIMVAAEDDYSLYFKNACGYICFKLYGKKMDVSSVSLTGKNDEKISGPATVTMTVGGVPNLIMAEDAGTVITVSCDTPVSLGRNEDNPTEFWFVVPPVNFSEGLTLSITDVRGTVYEIPSRNSFSITRNNILRINPVGVDID